MAKVDPLPPELLPVQPTDDRRRSSQPCHEGQHPALTQAQRPPGVPSDGQLHSEQQERQLLFAEAQYAQLQLQRQPSNPDELDVAPDSQYSWTVAWAAAWNIFCCSLLRRGMPVMFHAVDKTFSTTDKGSVAWTNAFIYSMTYTLFPVTTALCRTMSLRLLSVAGALLIGVGQIACFAIGSLSLVVPAIAVSCGGLLDVRHRVPPLLLLLLLDSYDLNGALLVFGATSLNALIGSMFMSRPVWMNPSIPLPPIHRPEASQNAAPAAIQPTATAQENTTKEVVNHKQEVPKPGTVRNEHLMGAKEMPGPSGAAPPGVLTGAPSVPPVWCGATGAREKSPCRRRRQGTTRNDHDWQSSGEQLCSTGSKLLKALACPP
ncbi:hypothetical protein MRX96_011935 [Rhipicephalus microplus]